MNWIISSTIPTYPQFLRCYLKLLKAHTEYLFQCFPLAVMSTFYDFSWGLVVSKLEGSFLQVINVLSSAIDAGSC